MKVSDFNKWFNKMFDKYKIDEEESSGLKSGMNTEEKDIKKVTKR